jgi:hypothetical protein
MDRLLALFDALTKDTMAISIAIAALIVSIGNLWLSQLWKGQVFLTQPTIFFFGWDNREGGVSPKIMFRTALFSSGNKGRVLESMHLNVKTEDGQFEFPVWGYQADTAMVKGSGLFVGTGGISVNHHFNPLNDEDAFAYTGKSYEIEIWAKVFNVKKDKLLGIYKLGLEDPNLQSKLAHFESGVLWNWSPSTRAYYAESFRVTPALLRGS